MDMTVGLSLTESDARQVEPAIKAALARTLDVSKSAVTITGYKSSRLRRLRETASRLRQLQAVTEVYSQVRVAKERRSSLEAVAEDLARDPGELTTALKGEVRARGYMVSVSTLTTRLTLEEGKSEPDQQPQGPRDDEEGTDWTSMGIYGLLGFGGMLVVCSVVRRGAKEVYVEEKPKQKANVYVEPPDPPPKQKKKPKVAASEVSTTISTTTGESEQQNENLDKIEELPDGWVEKMSRSSGRSYYQHKETGETQWDVPRTSPSAPPARVSAQRDGPKGRGKSEERGGIRDVDYPVLRQIKPVRTKNAVPSEPKSRVKSEEGEATVPPGNRDAPARSRDAPKQKERREGSEAKRVASPAASEARRGNGRPSDKRQGERKTARR
jgi:hypothetical protein